MNTTANITRTERARLLTEMFDAQNALAELEWDGSPAEVAAAEAHLRETELAAMRAGVVDHNARPTAASEYLIDVVGI